MKSIITEYINEDKRYQELNEVFGKENVLVTGLSGAAKATIIAEKYLNSEQQLLVVTNNLYQADKLESDLLQFVEDSEIYKYPMQDIMTEEFSTQSPQFMSERVRTLTALAQEERGLFIVPLNGLKKWLTPVDMWKSHQLTLNVGDDIDIDEFLNKLVNMGYPEYSKENCHFGILPMPTKYDENDTNDVEPAYYNFYNSFAFAKKTNLAWKEKLVKEFLRFCYTADELEAFTLQTGVARGLNYSIDETKLPSDFSEDVWAVHKSGNVVQQVSTSDIVNNNHNTFIMGRWKTNFANSVYSYFHTTPAATVKDYFDATKTSTMVTSIWGGQ